MSYCKKHNITYDKKNCPECKKEWDRNYYKNNRERVRTTQKNYVENNKIEIASYKSQYYLDHKNEKNEYDKIYRETHSEEIKEYAKNWHRSRYENDVFFRLSSTISVSIRRALSNNSSSKNGISCFTKLSYSTNELKQHIELLFEPWMTWDNYGIYDPKTWDDNDVSTWTWQLDHIIPQSDLSYTSMDDDNFKECWALENLRPLSAKQNLIEGVKRTRHSK